MIQKSRLWSQFNELPPPAQRQVANLIASLSARYRSHVPPLEDAPYSLRDEEFVGLWSDRRDLEDSAAWVRRVRGEEWQTR